MTKQMEKLRPNQIRSAFSQNSLVWLPLGTIEWHCEHLPVGLDGLTAHGLCLRAANQAGGLVLPPLYFGTGGGHSQYPFTIMLEGVEEIEAILTRTAERLQEMSIEKFIIFSGHFANEQLEMMDQFAKSWNQKENKLQVTATAVNRCEEAKIKPDHAGAFETLLINALEPETVDLTLLPLIKEAPDIFDRHDPQSPIWGVFGRDPRDVDLSQSKALLEHMTSWLARQAL